MGADHGTDHGFRLDGHRIIVVCPRYVSNEYEYYYADAPPPIRRVPLRLALATETGMRPFQGLGNLPVLDRVEMEVIRSRSGKVRFIPQRRFRAAMLP